MDSTRRILFSYPLAGAAIALAVAIIVVQWELEMLTAGWVMVLRDNGSRSIPESDGGQLMVHTLLRLVSLIRFGTGLAVGIAVASLALGWQRRGSRWAASVGLALSAVAVWVQWTWWQHLRWS